MNNFEYAHPKTEEDAVALLSSGPQRTMVLAGGTDLVPLLKRQVVSPQRVVNISDIDTMRQIDSGPNGELAIGASVCLDTILASRAVDAFPAIKQVIQQISSVQLRAQGTIGGELCERPRCWYFRNDHGLLAGKQAAEGDNRYHAILANSGPAKFVNASRLAPALISLGAEVRVIGPGKDDELFVPLEDLYQIPKVAKENEHTLQPGQLITHIVLPAAGMRLSAAYEVRHGEGPDAPLAAAAATLQVVGGVVRTAKIVMGQVAPTPWISNEASQAIVGRAITAQTAEEAGKAAVRQATPLKDNAYKVRLASVSVKRALLQAAGLDPGGF